MQRTAQQNSIFHQLLTLRKFDKEDKVELVLHFTDGRTRSSAEMTKEEMQLAINRLQDEQDSSLKKMRSKIINIGRDIFELKPKDEWTQKHYDMLNTFLKNKFKKELSKLDYKTLIKAVTAMEKWRDDEMKKMLKTLLNDV